MYVQITFARESSYARAAMPRFCPSTADGSDYFNITWTETSPGVWRGTDIRRNDGSDVRMSDFCWNMFVTGWEILKNEYADIWDLEGRYLSIWNVSFTREINDPCYEE